MADKIVTLHPQGNTSDNLYPRVLGQSVQAGANISIDSTANTISVAQSLVDTIDGKQAKGDYVLSSALSSYYTSAQTDSLLGDYMKSSDIQTNYALKSSLPTKVSQLTNDSGYLTSPDLKTSVSVVSNSDDTTSLSVSVGGVSSSAKTNTLKVGYASYANAIGTSSSNYTKSTLDTALNGKQATLVSGTNLKTINNTSLLGSGNIAISGNVTIGHVDIANTETNIDNGLFYEAFTKHKAILGVYYVMELSETGDYYSCIYNYGYSDQDPAQTTYYAYFRYVRDNATSLQSVPSGSTIRIVYLD